MQKLTLSLFTFIIMFLLTSCDKWGSLSYIATNETDETITIQYYNLSDEDTMSVSIAANATEVLLVSEELIAKEFPEDDFSEFTINIIAVEKGNVPSITDFSNRAEWTYSKTAKEEAAFQLDVKNDDF